MIEVTVVTPTYNRDRRLRRAIESVLDQTVADFEYLVVDDCSDQVDTERVVAEYCDERIRCLTHGQNKGAAAARNTGLEAANGEYIAFLDSDDYWRPRKLEMQLSSLRGRSSDWIGIYCNVDRGETGPVIGRLSRFISTSPGVAGDEAVIRELVFPNSGLALGSTLLVRREAVAAAGPFDESFSRYEEIELCFRLLSHGKIGFVDEPLAVIGNSAYPSAESVETSNERLVEVLYDRFGETDIDVEAAVASHDFLLARCFFREARFREGLHYLRKGRSHEPSQYLRLLYALTIGFKRRVTAW